MSGREPTKAAPRWLQLAPDLVGVAGLICICTGTSLLLPAIGWIVAGASCLAVAWRLAVLESRSGSSS